MIIIGLSVVMPKRVLCSVHDKMLKMAYAQPRCHVVTSLVLGIR